METLDALLRRSAKRHRHRLCPRQVLGVRMGLYAGELLDLELPRQDKRLFAFVETDGCLTDGIAAATSCALGSRTMRLIDYGKSAATLVDTVSNRAIRIWPRPEARANAWRYAPDAPDRWHAQLVAYQMMPTAELLCAQTVSLNVSLEAIISQHGRRVVCARCGEDIANEREVQLEGESLCRSCAGDAYYSLAVDGGGHEDVLWPWPLVQDELCQR